jgi:hypothetical protein
VTPPARAWPPPLPGPLALGGRLALLVLLLALGACAPDPRARQAGQLLDQLDAARAALAADAAQGEAVCGTSESVVTGLEAVPGLDELRATYIALRDASDALTAACGQARLVELAAVGEQQVQPDEHAQLPERTALAAAEQRWRAGLARDLALTCRYLRDAARSLDRAPPRCDGA